MSRRGRGSRTKMKSGIVGVGDGSSRLGGVEVEELEGVHVKFTAVC